jgi:ATP-dependent Clp protease ATP-binding subunit ClpC
MINVLLFLPYYFNVQSHFKNLFAPWKRIVSVKKERGFSFEALMDRLSMDWVSRGVGFVMRVSVIITYLVVMTLYAFVAIPVWLLVSILLTPFAYLLQQIIVSAHSKERRKKIFVESHVCDAVSTDAVTAWFERQYAKKVQDSDAFSLENLLLTPPIGRDWAYGYTPTLDNYCTDITTIISSTRELQDRVEEIRMIERALGKTYEANIILVGEEGVGKHAIVGGLAERMYHGTTTPPLQNLRMVELDMERVLSAGKSHEEKESLLNDLLQEASLASNLVVVINNFHLYCSASLVGDFSDVWERFGKSPRVKFVAITTPFYFQHVVYHNDKIARLFSKVAVEEISTQKALLILEDKALYLEGRYGLTIPFETLQQVITRSKFYITHVPFPEKAIELLDEVCAFVGDGHAKESRVTGRESKVMPEDVDTVLSQKMHTPIGPLHETTKHTLLNLFSLLKKSLVGQDAALTEVTHAVQRAFIEENRTKPKVSLMFLGPTGVGKTETAKTIAKLFFGTSENIIRLDMSFYQNKESLGDLIGSFEKQNPGLLAEKIREKPFTVLLIDEIEKAHKDLLNVFLTLLDEGYVVDGYGKKVDAKNLIVVATSNAGAHEIYDWAQQGMRGNELTKEVRQLVIEKGILSPEFLNRFDKVLVFEPINVEDAIRIGYAVMEKVTAQYQQEKNITISVSPGELEMWVREVFNSTDGVREIERVVREKVAEKAAEVLLK